MKLDTFSLRSPMPVSAEELFRWHARPGALERLTPPWESAEVVARTGRGIEVGAQVTVRMKVGPIPQEIIAEHTLYEEGKRFRDVMIKGPFSYWQHTHLTDPDTESTSFLEDSIEYSVPGGALGRAVGGGMVRDKLNRAFAYRHRITRDDVSDHKAANLPPMRIAITGSRGLVGTALIPFLTTGGHSVTPVVRGKVPRHEQEIAWDPAQGLIAKEDLEGFDAIIHLAGEPVINGRWNKESKQRIYDSRVKSTQLLTDTINKLARPPKVFLSASAIGIYGDRADETLTEESSVGSGFLAEVCRDWEAASFGVKDKTRVVNLRIGVVLSPLGGALKQMYTPFQMGLGSTLGDGSQYMSWVSMDDTLSIILKALADERIEGPLNVTAPHPVTNAEMTKTLAKVLSRPAFLAAPSGALRLAFGEAANEAILASAKVLPQKLTNLGHRFRYPDLEGALRHMLGR